MTTSSAGSNATTSTAPVGVTGGGSAITAGIVTQTNCNNQMNVVVSSGNGSSSIQSQSGGQQQSQTPQPNPTTTTTISCSTSQMTNATSSLAGNGSGAVTTSSVTASVSGSGPNSSNGQGLMSIKEEPNMLGNGSAQLLPSPTQVINSHFNAESSIQIKREDESPNSGTPPGMSGGGVNVKKEPIQLLNSNGSTNTGGIIGSTNTGSLHHNEKTSNDSNVTDDLLATKDEILSDSQTGIVTMQSMVSIKKEEPGPDLSTDSFGPLGVALTGGGGGNGSGNNGGVSGSSSNTNIQGSTGNSNNNNRIPPNTSPTENVQLQGNLLGNTKQSGVSGMDYMQQQSHIFVFSTSLANKGAESVLSGQYPTIIAYHCAQPSTKKFLEEFFHKNPLKLSKINRQNPAQWMNSNMPLGTKTKSSNSSNGSNNSNNPNRMIPTTKPQSTCNTNFVPDDLSGGDPELLPWEQSAGHLVLDTISNGSGGNVNAPSNTDVSSLEVDNLVPGSPSLNPNRSCSNHMTISSTTANNMQQSPTTNTTSAIGPTSPSLSGGLQPSLQGVKVPDENLTPQQRQHREEQLAKLKKMNQFLFPEQGGIGPEFLGGVPPDGVEQNLPPGGKIMGPAGNTGPVGMMGQMQMPGGMGQGLRGSSIMGMGPRGPMCRPMGPMCPSQMQDSMMGSGSVPPNNPGINEMGGMQCGMMPAMIGNQQQQSNMMGGPPNMGQQPMVQGGGPMNACGMVGQNKHAMPGFAQMEWSKLQHQFYEERKGKGMDGLSVGGMCAGNPVGMPGGVGRQLSSGMRSSHQGGSRSQGPPPPYHQTQRSASVPIATQSPNPGSPNNPTSNLSLPSPRGGSTLNSPAGDHNAPGSTTQQGGTSNNSNRQQLPYKQDSPVTGSTSGTGGNSTSRSSLTHNSNPGTPISSHLSPNANSLKDLELGSSSAVSQGQELTIQKQPNTTLKDGGSIISPPGGGGNSVGNGGGDNRLSGSSTPLTPSSMESRFPTTPGGAGSQVSVGGMGGGSSAGSTFPIPSSPQTPNTGGVVNSSQNNGEKSQRIGSSGPSPQGSRTPSMSDTIQNSTSMPSSVDSVRFPPASPGINFSGSSQPGGGSNQQPNPMKISGFMDVSPTGKCSTSTNDTPSNGNFCVRADNLPLNPNSSCPPPAKTSHFDPISSLAQMSQQLTSSVPSSLNGQPPNSGPGSGSGAGGGNGGGGGVNPGSGMMSNFQNHGGMGMPGDMSMSGHHVDSLMGGMDPCGMGGVMPGMGQYGMHGPGGGGIPLGMMGGPGPRSISPKLNSGMVGFPGGPVGMPHRMIGRPPMGGSPYNGANIQVKASTPNTIQYLPARPQVGNPNPRGPPSLEFLRYTNPMSSMDGPNKVPSGQNMPFYPNCNQMGQPGGMGMGGHMDTSVGLGGGDGSGMLNMGGMGPGGPMGMGQNMIMRGLRPPGQGAMVRMSGPPHMGGGGGAHHHHPFSNGPPNGGPNDPSMFANNQMFAAGTKGNPMNPGGPNIPGGGPGVPHPSQMGGGGGGPPDATQPLPPSMGGQPPGGSFKSSQFVGPSTADPNYAQQYHNFQQQLYATSTRSQLSNQPGGGGMPVGPNNPNQQSFFVSK